jgi:hypothetical protein
MAAMATSRAQRTAALALDLPASAIVRRQLKDYLGRSGMSPAEFGERIDYSYPAVQNFIYDTYGKISGSDLAIRRAIVEFIEAHPLAAMTMADGKLYETENVRLLRKYFYAALDRGYAYYVDGGPGSQKTFVLQHLIAELNRKEIAKNGAGKRAYYVRCRPKISPTQLLKRICQACGVSGTGDVERMIRALRHEFAKRRVRSPSTRRSTSRRRSTRSRPSVSWWMSRRTSAWSWPARMDCATCSSAARSCSSSGTRGCTPASRCRASSATRRRRSSAASLARSRRTRPTS